MACDTGVKFPCGCDTGTGTGTVALVAPDCTVCGGEWFCECDLITNGGGWKLTRLNPVGTPIT